MSGPLLGDADRDRRLILRARRDIRAWRFRAVALGAVAGLFLWRRAPFGALVFLLLAVGAWQIARSTARRLEAVRRRLEMLGPPARPPTGRGPQA